MAVRFLICGGIRSGSVEEGLAAAALGISDGTIKTKKELAQTLAKVIPSDQRFLENFKIATVSGAHFARYYLRSLEESAKGGANPHHVVNDNQNVINLEHVLPLKPGTNWPQFSSEDAAGYVSRLGNMALLQAKKNADLHSKAFAEKREAYKDTPYEWTRQIASVPSWTPETINRRQEKMAEAAVKIWKI